MPADVIDFGDTIAAELQRAFDQAGAIVAVTREYEITYDLGTFEGIKCHVFAEAVTGAKATRRENYFDPECVVTFGERYTGTGRPPRQWLDDRVHIVERCVYDVIERIELPLMAGHYWQTELDWSRVCHRDLLREHKVFWSEVEAVFRRVRETKPRGG